MILAWPSQASLLGSLIIISYLLKETNLGKKLLRVAKSRRVSKMCWTGAEVGRIMQRKNG